MVDWLEFGHRLTMMGDDYSFTLGFDLIHKSETVCFEKAYGHSFHFWPFR